VTGNLEVENDAGRDAQIVLRFAVRCGFREARQKAFNLHGTPGQTVKEIHINPAAEGGGESVAAATCAEDAAACVRDAKERLAQTITI
jgi:hypothetical protein